MPADFGAVEFAGAEKGTGFVKRHVIGGQGDSRLRGTEGMFYAHQVKQEFKRQVVGENASALERSVSSSPGRSFRRDSER